MRHTGKTSNKNRYFGGLLLYVTCVYCTYSYDRPKLTERDDIHDEVAMRRQMVKYENHQIVEMCERELNKE